jgi:hypothetical protein
VVLSHRLTTDISRKSPDISRKSIYRSVDDKIQLTDLKTWVLTRLT